MKALSLTQPMAWAIFHGKDIENRVWTTKFRGRVRIHASKKFDKEHWSWIVDNDNRLVTGGVPIPSDFIHGALIGEVDIIDCVTNHGSRWWFGPYGFVLANAVEYEIPIPCKGMLGFFTPQIDVKYLMPPRFICCNTGKEYELIDCIRCDNICEPMKKQLSQPTTRRVGMVSGK